jgi:hypothetical protein
VADFRLPGSQANGQYSTSAKRKDKSSGSHKKIWITAIEGLPGDIPESRNTFNWSDDIDHKYQGIIFITQAFSGKFTSYANGHG